MKSTLQNIAINIGVNWKFIGQVLYSNNSNSRNHFYRVTKIPKRNGKNRTIHAVKGELKILQRKVLEWLSEMYMPSKHAKGFKKKSGIIENAIIHHNKKLILKFDLKDFFPSITFARVRGMFQAYPFDFTEKQSTVLAQISCLDNNGPIPQGGITSPYISNMICRKLDSRLSKFAIKTGMRYSRYADDLTFSTNKWIEIDEIVNSISEIVNTEGFILNNEKTRILNKSKRQAVTGLVVNDGLNVNRRYIRNLRALIYNCKRSGVKSQLTKNNYKDLRNTCSNITISKSGDYYSYRSGLIKKSDNKSIEKIAIEKFMYHIRGMIEFVGQVAKANEPLCEKNYLTRTGIYEQLINNYSELAVLEKISKPLKWAANTYLKSIQNSLKINYVENCTLEELKKVKYENAGNDIRYFCKSFSETEINLFRKELLSLLQYPKPNADIVASYLTDCLDSQNKILGRLLHSSNVGDKLLTQRELYHLFKEYNVEKKYFLPLSLRKTFDKLLSNDSKSGLPSKLFKYQPEDELDLYSDTQFRENYLNPFKEATRFGRGDDSTDLSLLITEIVNSGNIKNIIDKKKIKLKFTLAKSIYTDVLAVGHAISKLLESMVKHTSSNVVHMKFKLLGNSGRTELLIHDENTLALDVNCSRNEVANGKIRNAILDLYGLGQYYFIANFENVGWRCINMYFDNKVEDTDKHLGVTHKVILNGDLK